MTMMTNPFVYIAAVCCVYTLTTCTAESSGDFLVMGDWGGMPVWPYYDPAEHGIAKSMGSLAKQVNATYTLALGDNFYTNGVKSVTDKRFKETFEDVFTSSSLQNANHFRLVAGNHDHYGNASAEVAYTQVSSRWHFPSFYYDFKESIGPVDAPKSIHFVMIDTVLLSGDSRDAETGEDLDGDAYTGPKDEKVADEQWTWINETLAQSDADFLIVAGHFPVWSICEHGPTSILVQRLKPMLEEAKASAYLAGHDHCAQHIDEGKGVQYHGIGAGILSNPTTKHKDDIPANSLLWHHDNSILGELKGAFGHISYESGGLVVSHLSSDGKNLYTAPPIPPRP